MFAPYADMESLYLNRSTSSCFSSNSATTPQIPLFNPPTRSLQFKTRPRCLVTLTKNYDFQDFQGYANPTSLSPATEVKVFTNAPPEEIFTSTEDMESRSLYKIVLRTSPAYGSGITNLNAGILLCIIDDSGRSILQRIPASSYRPSDDFGASDLFHFQRGSLDQFVFRGHKLGKIEAIWIGLESGRWRFDGANLTVINRTTHQSGVSDESGKEYTKIRYDFEAEDILLGEGSKISMVELRPSWSVEFSGTDLSSLLADSVVRSPSLGDDRITKEESMREYGDLKFSLLLYDAMLICAGTSIASFADSDHTALAFLSGGICGFFYLLLLQRSVDQLPAPESIHGATNVLFKGVKGPIVVLALAFGFVILVAKLGSVGVESPLGAKELVAGMFGFLVCKIAVILAATMPLSMTPKDTD